MRKREWAKPKPRGSLPLCNLFSRASELDANKGRTVGMARIWDDICSDLFHVGALRAFVFAPSEWYSVDYNTYHSTRVTLHPSSPSIPVTATASTRISPPNPEDNKRNPARRTGRELYV